MKTMARKSKAEEQEIVEEVSEASDDNEMPLVPLRKSETKKVIVEITGKTPILMNNPRSMMFEEEAKGSVVSTTRKRDPVAEAETRAYRMKDGNLYIPAEALKGCLVNAASYKKFGKYSAKPIIAGCVQILPQQISLKTKDYDIDERTVVIRGRGRVIRARPMVDKWKLTFELEYDAGFIQSSNLIREILEEGGQRIGIMDFRPAKLGSFGMFRVTKWDEKA
jgi:hypothetical protein